MIPIIVLSAYALKYDILIFVAVSLAALLAITMNLYVSFSKCESKVLLSISLLLKAVIINNSNCNTVTKYCTWW
jgi:hypothetical protein